MVTIVHHCTDGTVLRLRRPSQPELEQRNIYRTLRLAATPALQGRSRLSVQQQITSEIAQVGLGLVIRFGKDAAATMARNPFLPVVDKDRKVKGWDYGHAAQYADYVGIPAGAEVRATAAVRRLWPQLSDGSVVVSRDRLESRIAMAAGIDVTEAKRWVEVVVRGGLLEPMGDQVVWRADAQAERAIAAEIRRRMASGG